jgi:hypothetical protein
MTIHDSFEGALYVATVVELAKKFGIKLISGEDFNEYAEIIAEGRPEQPVGVPFDPKFNDIKPGDGFWIIGRNEADELVFTQAVRLLRIEGESFCDYMRQEFVKFPPAGLPIDFDRSFYHPGPSARRMSGTMAYHGDVWMRGGVEKYRGTGLSSVLARLALVTALMTWAPDHMFGFIIRKLAFKGLGEREGYMHSDPAPLHWYAKDKPDPMVAHMCWMNRDDLRHLLPIPAESVMA